MTGFPGGAARIQRLFCAAKRPGSCLQSWKREMRGPRLERAAEIEVTVTYSGWRPARFAEGPGFVQDFVPGRLLRADGQQIIREPASRSHEERRHCKNQLRQIQRYHEL